MIGKEWILRNGFYLEEPERRPLFKNRTAGLVVSLVLHTLLVYGLYRARMTLKILAVRSDVKNVLLVPPVRITVPSPIDKYIQNPAAGEPLGFESRGGDRRPGRGNPRNKAHSATEGESRKESGLAPENLMKNMPGGQPEPESGLTSELGLGKRYRWQENGKYVINLSALPDHIEDAPLGFEGGPNQRYRPLQKYVHPGRAGIEAGTSGGGGSGGQRARVLIQSPGYDISPWAKKVIDIIQVNWKIPEAVRILDKSEVRFAITIEKNGSLSAFKMLGGTALEVLNGAAAAALTSSVPLPPLPDDFPRPNLEALFVFAYHD
jgi:hypothetical protein